MLIVATSPRPRRVSSSAAAAALLPLVFRRRAFQCAERFSIKTAVSRKVLENHEPR